MTDTLYRSHQSVPQRVDAAWQKGFEAGLVAKRDRLALVALAISAVTLWRQVDTRKNSHLLPWAVLASVVALLLVLCTVPVVLAGLAVRTGYRHHRATLARKPSGSTVPVVVRSSDEYEPF